MVNSWPLLARTIFALPLLWSAPVFASSAEQAEPEQAETPPAAFPAEPAAAEGIAVYEARVEADPDNPEWRFRLAMLQLQLGNAREAIDHLREILVDHPDALRVRLELARAYFLVNDHTNAERQFRLVRAGELPAVVAANVDRFLGSIRAERSWSIAASFGIAPDTNINAATAAETIELYGLPFDLSSEGRKSSGIGLTG